MGPDRARIAAARALAHDARGARGRRALRRRRARSSGPATSSARPSCSTRPARGSPVPGSALLAAALRRRGLRVHVGPLASTERILGPAERQRHAATALAVDMESAWLAAGAGRPAARRRPRRCRRSRAAPRRPAHGARRPARAAQPAPGERALAEWARPWGRGRCCSPARARSAPASTRPRTGRTRCARLPASPTSCSSPAPRPRRTPSAWSRSPAARAPAPTSSTTRPTSTWPGSPGAATVGITAGASAPERIVHRLVERARRPRPGGRRGAHPDRRVAPLPPPRGASTLGLQACPRSRRTATPARCAPSDTGANARSAEQSLTVARYLAKRRLARDDKFPLLVELEPLFQCNLACSFCGKIQYPEHILKKRMPVEHRAGRDRGVGRADGLDRRRRAARPPRGARDRAGADRAEEVRLPVHERDPDEEEARPVRAVALLRLGRAPRRHARAPRRVRRARGHLRQGGRRDPGGPEARVPRQHEHDLPDHRHAEDRAGRARLPERRAEGRPDDALAGLRVREGARPGALPGRRRRRGSCSARRLPTAGASAGGSTTRRSSSTSSRARSTSSARRGASPATRSSAGSGPATSWPTATRPPTRS